VGGGGCCSAYHLFRRPSAVFARFGVLCWRMAMFGAQGTTTTRCSSCQSAGAVGTSPGLSFCAQARRPSLLQPPPQNHGYSPSSPKHRHWASPGTHSSLERGCCYRCLCWLTGSNRCSAAQQDATNIYTTPPFAELVPQRISQDGACQNTRP